jgi:hypothetical protein
MVKTLSKKDLMMKYLQFLVMKLEEKLTETALSKRKTTLSTSVQTTIVTFLDHLTMKPNELSLTILQGKVATPKTLMKKLWTESMRKTTHPSECTMLVSRFLGTPTWLKLRKTLNNRRRS